MFTRSAVFEGTIRPGQEDAFFAIVENELLPIWKRMPNAQAVRVMRTVEPDAGAPSIVMVQEVDYPSREAIAEALASPVRSEGRAATDRLAEFFDGRFYHFVYERMAPR